MHRTIFRNNVLSLTGLMGLALIIRLYRLGTYSLWGDEADTVYAGVNRVFVHPPLFITIAAWWAKWTSSDFTLRLLPVFFSVVTVALTWLLARRVLKSSSGAFWAALFIAMSPSQVYAARDFRMYSMFAMMGALSWITWLNWVEKGGWPQYIMVVIAGSMTVYTHHYGFFLLTAQGCSAVFMKPRKTALLRLSAYTAGVALLYLPYLQDMLYFASRFVGSNNWAPPVTWKTTVYMARYLLSGLEPSYRMAAVMIVIGGCLFVAGVLAQKNREFHIVVIFGLVLPVAMAMVASYVLPTSMFIARYLIFTSIPLAVALGAGADVMSSKKTLLILPALLIVLQFGAITLQYRNIYLAPAVEVREREEFRQACHLIMEHYEPGDVLGTTSLSGTYPAWFYLTFRHSLMPITLVDVDDYHRRHLHHKYNQNDFIAEVYTLVNPVNLDEFLENTYHLRFWLYESQWTPGILPGNFYYDQRIRCRTWLKDRFPLIGEWSFKGVDVRLFDLQSPLMSTTEESTETGNLLN